MGPHAQPGGGMSSNLVFGPFTRFGLAVAAASALADQAVKLWLMFVFDLPDRGVVALGPYVDLILTWNTGISYGLFQQQGPLGTWALIALKAVAVALLLIWLARASSRMTALGLGLIIGGAIGNAVDRLHWPGVMDFVLLHVTVGGVRYNWYVFNLADAAIVAGVIGLLYESLLGERAAKAPRSRP
jgi:signal peptidase II